METMQTVDSYYRDPPETGQHEYCISVGGNGPAFIHADSLDEAIDIYVSDHIRECDDVEDVEGYQIRDHY